MAVFKDREKGFEAHYKHDQETQFKVTARRNKLLGLWAAEKLGLSGDDAEAFAKQVVVSDFDEPGDEDVYRKVAGDLDGKGVSEKEIRHQMENLIAVASEQIAEDS